MRTRSWIPLVAVVLAFPLAYAHAVANPLPANGYGHSIYDVHETLTVTEGSTFAVLIGGGGFLAAGPLFLSAAGALDPPPAAGSSIRAHVRLPHPRVLLAGDGVGPEVMREGVKVLKAVESGYGVSFDLVPFPCGGQHYLDTGEEWPDGVFESCKAADAILLGAVGLPEAVLPNGDVAGVGVVFGLRFGLDLYANVRPTKLYPNVRHKIHDGFKLVWEPGKVDFVIVRENTEGLYTPNRGFLDRGGGKELAVDSRVITRKGAERVIRFAFELSKQRRGAPSDGKHRVTCVDKSNVTAGCKLFRQVYDEAATRYPTVLKDYAYIDPFQQWLIRSPEVFDVAVTSNMFGDIATDLAEVVQGC